MNYNKLRGSGFVGQTSGSEPRGPFRGVGVGDEKSVLGRLRAFRVLGVHSM